MMTFSGGKESCMEDACFLTTRIYFVVIKQIFVSMMKEVLENIKIMSKTLLKMQMLL